jgi:DNA-directed RNA polymerase subunit N (RpoN/RPB10)
MARCNQCNKFVSYDEPQVEEQNCDVNDMTVEGEVSVTLCCADCGTEMSQAYLEFSEDFEHECEGEPTEEWLKDHEADDDPEFSLESSDNWSPTDRYEDKDRHGKPIKNMRYQKHYYGAEGTATVKCLKCGKEFEVNIQVEEQASGFEDCQ